ncbi:hypothetical protein C8A01DRAFT_32977 [Parachaetomium inaequale]|uniref:Uncharacterized protein n=1 Tax=Parachaetomium inaequale TaxID=2588326 RepID=A0AAN6PQR8_9PEZI|nr:hypothetical protein C8A01DRAFT_32977 [Parachaetomium inaequale]
MLPPLRTALARASRSTPSLTHLQLRRYSSQKQPSATGTFYKTFTRPVAKCALLAVFVYQLVYFGWAKLETDEIKAERQAEIIKLEAHARSLHAAQAAQAAAAAAAASEGSSEGGSAGDGGDGAKGAGSSWWRWK